MAYPVALITDARGNIVRVAHPELPRFPATVSTAVTAGAVALVVGDNQGFALNDLAILGQVGQDKTELITVNGAVTHGTALSITAAIFDHPADVPVQKALWDQVEISGANTVTGSKTVIVTTSLEYGMTDTEYVVTGATYVYYFARFKNSASGVFSSYSDAAPAAGYGSDTVRAVKREALNLTGQTTEDGVITDDFLDTQVQNCEIDLWKEKRRWAQFEIDNYVLGTLSPGIVQFTLPTNISEPSTNEAIRSVRVRQVGELAYLDQESVDDLLWDTALSTLSIQALAGDTSITLVSVADFQDSGSILLGVDSVTYTGRDTSTNVLSGIPASGDGSITVTHTSGSNVWQGGNVENSPSVYTIIPGILSIVLPTSPSYQDQAIYLNYYSKPTLPDSDTDVIEWPDPELYHFYLAWKIELRLHNGSPTDSALNFKGLYDSRKALLLSRARLQDTPKMIPRRRIGRQQLGAIPDGNIVSWIIH